MWTEFKMPTQLKFTLTNLDVTIFGSFLFSVCFLGRFVLGGNWGVVVVVGGGEYKLFFSLAVLLLLHCCNFVRHCVLSACNVFYSTAYLSTHCDIEYVHRFFSYKG